MKITSVAILINNISKSYKLYQSPTHRIKETFHPFRKKYNTNFHALKNVSIEIKSGETVGIIGRNGCGKSTLLQIVCSIMPPTSGELLVNGRISAILELGAGFNPEFSGRDNVYLNCSILGMERSDIEKRMDAIVEFADIGDFIDQPVKSYSSGMNVRLAFSIAINVDPAILIVDEALSVGDAAFQRKCFSRIKTIQEQGATILFVSHDAGTIVELCDRVILLDQGEMLYVGSPKQGVALYHKLLFAPQDKIAFVRNAIVKTTSKVESIVEEESEQNEEEKVEEKVGSKAYLNKHLSSKSTTWYEPNGAMIQDPHILTLDGRRVNVLIRNEEYYYAYNVQFSKSVFSVRFCMLIKTVRGLELGGYGNKVENESVERIGQGSSVDVKLRFSCVLLPGAYFLNAGVMGMVQQNDEYLHRGIDVVMFEVMPEANIAATGMVDFAIKTGSSIVKE